MELLKRVIGYAVLALQIFILIVLIFHDSVQVPLWLQTVGRMHPLLLHLPIGLLLICLALAFTQKYFADPGNKLLQFLLHITALTASLSAFMGLLLSYEGGYEQRDLLFHQWFGVALSFICWALIALKLKTTSLKFSLIFGSIILIITGHFGASLTHGEDFVMGPLLKKEVSPHILSDSATLFAAAVEPILEAKCYSCHNESKAKGKLILTSAEDLLRGGKHGKLFEPGNAEKSLLMERLNLPPDVKEHMPPKDKAQLSKDELDFIALWITTGADMNTKLLDADDSLKQLSASIVERYHSKQSVESLYPFEFVSQDKITKLNTPYRTVFQIAVSEPALQADFYLSGSFQKKYLDELRDVKEQIVAINLSRMPVSDDDLKTIADFKNIEKIILNQTSIDGSGLNALKTLEKLQIVSLSGTKVSKEDVAELGENKNLNSVFLWNTSLTENDILELRKKFPSINWDMGYAPDANEKLRLSPAILKNDGQVLKKDEKVAFKHNLPGAEIRYSVNEKMPDSVSGVIYKEPIVIKDYAIVRTKAFKDGWISSKSSEYIFFPAGVKPDRGELKTKPEDRYLGDGITTLIDSRKGMPDFYRDPVWMGFRKENLEALFYFEKNIPTITSVTLSYSRNTNSWVFPPAEMEVWGGNDAGHLKLLASIKPDQPSENMPVRIEGANVVIPSSNFPCYKIVAKPLAKLPAFLKQEKERGWLMVDEIFFN